MPAGLRVFIFWGCKHLNTIWRKSVARLQPACRQAGVFAQRQQKRFAAKQRTPSSVKLSSTFIA